MWVNIASGDILNLFVLERDTLELGHYTVNITRTFQHNISDYTIPSYETILGQSDILTTYFKVLSCGQSFFPILWVIRLHWYRKFVKCIAIIIPTCRSQYRRSARNPLFSTMGQIDQVDRRFNLDPTTPNCIYSGALN